MRGFLTDNKGLLDDAQKRLFKHLAEGHTEKRIGMRNKKVSSNLFFYVIIVVDEWTVTVNTVHKRTTSYLKVLTYQKVTKAEKILKKTSIILGRYSY